MKKAAILFIFCIFQLLVFAQDVIFRTDGIEIKSKVLEIDENFIKYKNFDQQEGPVRSIQKSLVFMIKYSNGTIEKFTTIMDVTTEPLYDSTIHKKEIEVKDLDIQIEKAMSMKRFGKNLVIPGAFIFAGGTVLFTVSFNQAGEAAKKNMKTFSYIFFAASTPLLVAGSILFIKGQSELKTLKRIKAGLSFQMVPFDNNKHGRFIPAVAPTIGFRISF